MGDASTTRAAIEKVAADNGVSIAAAQALFDALAAGGGNMAQFSHPDLGGLGQWSRGGMLMIGDMFNDALKARVSKLCNELAPLAAEVHREAASRRTETAHLSAGRGWWPTELGMPGSTGSQNDMRYALFPAKRRLAINEGGAVSIYETGEHVISGISQQQGGERTVAFSSQTGEVRLSDLKLISRGGDEHARSVDAVTSDRAPNATPHDDILRRIEGLADLHRKAVITDDEFRAKKAELMARL